LYELVVREKPRRTIYLRKKPDRRIDISPRRLQHIINFSEIAHSGYGKTFEEFIEHIRSNVKPVGRKKKERIIRMSTSDFFKLILVFQRRGLRIRFPEHYKIFLEKPIVRVKPREKPLELMV